MELRRPTYIAERFFRRTGDPPTSTDGGFLPDPSSTAGRLLAKNTLLFEEVVSHPCAIILGEPGIGKSTLMERRRGALPADATFFDLKDCAPDDVLRSPDLESWLRGERQLHLVLDGLDLAPSPNFMPKLLERLEKGAPHTLRLEATCRATEWRTPVYERLVRLFGDQAVVVVHLEPLRSPDAKEIARSRGIDADSFMQTVFDRDLEPLASIPITLELLIYLFDTRGALPGTSSELYSQACLSLCTEPDPRRLPATDQDERLKVAAVLGAIMAFSHRWVISVKPRLAEEPQEIVVDRLVELVSQYGFSRRAILDTLSTGLFHQTGSGSWGWYHQTLAEHLAARWIGERLAAEQVRQVLFHPEDPDQVVPQLAGVAVWLAGMKTDVLELLARNAPEYFIVADNSLATDALRAIAVESLLDGVRRLSLSNYWWSPERLRRLSHAGLSAQLEPVILGDEGNPLVRKKALEILGANRLTSLQHKLCSLAEDRSVAASVRAEAVEAALSSPDDVHSALGRLRSLVEPGDTSDPTEDIRAAVLERLWPDEISSAELFRLLTRPDRLHHFGGRYDQFISNLPEQLRREHLVDALGWVSRNVPPASDSGYVGFEQLSARICRRALEHLDDGPTCRALATAVSKLLASYKRVFSGPIDDDDDLPLADAARRHRLTAAVADVSADPARDAYNLVHPYGQQPFVREDDVEWLLTAWSAATESSRSFWSELVRWLVRQRSQDRTLDLVLERVGEARTSSLLPWPRFLELDSMEVEEARKNEAEHLAWERQHEARNQQVRMRKLQGDDEVERVLRRALDGDNDAWWQVVAHLWRTTAKHQLHGLFQWDATTPERQQAIMRTACDYLLSRDAEPEKWISRKGITFWPALAGYLSLRLALEAAPEWFASNRTVLAERWVSAVICFDAHYFSTQGDRDGHRRLVEMCFADARSQALASLRAMLRRNRKEPLRLALLEYLPVGDDIAAVLEQSAKDLVADPSAREESFTACLRCSRSRALDYARTTIGPATGSRRKTIGSRGPTRPAKTPEAIRRWRSKLIGVLLRDGRPDTWELGWNACQRYPAAAREQLKRLSEQLSSRAWGEYVSDRALGDLFAWLESHIPIVMTEHSFTPGEYFRSQLLSRLVERGAVDTLSDILRRFPGDARVRSSYSAARRKYHEQSWQPIDPMILLELAALNTRRIVQSDEQLLAATWDALKRYENHLHSETPAVVDLWNYDRRPKRKRHYWPKDENHFSDHIKRYLHNELKSIIVNREVEIRSPEGQRKGQRTDLLVQAIDPEAGRRFGVVVEVKCRWSAKLEEDIDDQLTGRYLSRGDLRCGIYCVGWFECAAWDPSDRRALRGKRDRAKLLAVLESQAANASVGGRVVRVAMVDAGV